MIDIRDHRINVLQICDASCTQWDFQGATFFQPDSAEEADTIRQWCHSWRNGDIARVRGRDYVVYDGDNLLTFEPWEYGLALKMGRRFFLLWDSEVESILIDGCNFLDRLHFECHLISNFSPPTINISPRALTVVLCHGFCEEEGPNYALVCVLKHALTSAGYQVIVPDFRPSYKYGSHRSRSERVRLILEAIIVDMGARLQAQQYEPQNGYVLIGHSQGGAAVAQLCESSGIVAGAKIHGLLLLGSESPTEQLRTNEMVFWGEDPMDHEEPVVIHSSKPDAIPAEAILCIHAENDRVIHHMQIDQLAERWGCRFVRLKSDVKPDHDNASWANDIQHDFMAKDMLMQVLFYMFTHITTIEENITYT